MRTTTSDHRSTPRLAAALLGVALCAAVIGGCSSSPSSSGPSTTTTSTTAPTPTGPGGTQSPGISIPTQPPTVETPSATVPVTPVPTVPVSPTMPPTSPSSGNPPSGTTFPGEGLTAQQAADLQTAVDNGHQPWRLDRVQVAKTFAQSRFGWTNVQTSTGAPMVVFVTNADGSKVALHLIQPATKGDTGIWEVDSGVWS
ncbi:hypothetical protein GPX89_27730 [Nocardia sp. ET3-3]|uniref:Uncharacterized protein n=1 Tax=Nocardia terrae TaxID=2675851 RepID=A0A7K1V3E1_9NOCA|nr:hypothetical protein [Nocardia terrae]MVU81027.1 hypothetical protein [Nocardia terrae]